MRLPETRVLAALIFDFDHTLTDFGRGVDWQTARDQIVALYEYPALMELAPEAFPLDVVETALGRCCAPGKRKPARSKA